MCRRFNSCRHHWTSTEAILLRFFCVLTADVCRLPVPAVRCLRWLFPLEVCRGGVHSRRASLHCVPLRTLPASATSLLRNDLHPPGPVPLRKCLPQWVPEVAICRRRSFPRLRVGPFPLREPMPPDGKQPLSGTGKHFRVW